MMPRFRPGEDDEFDDETSDPGEPEVDPRSDPRWPPLASPRTSGMALASVICGVMFCLAIPSLFAVLFGLIAMRETRDRSVSGRGFAVAGLTLGLIGTAAWLVFAALLYVGISLYNTEVAEADKVCTAFVQDLADGKVDAALARSVPGSDRKPLAEASDAMKAWGPFNHLVASPRMISARESFLRWEVEGDAVFSRGGCEVDFRVVKDGTTYRVERFEWKRGG